MIALRIIAGFAGAGLLIFTFGSDTRGRPYRLVTHYLGAISLGALCGFLLCFAGGLV